MNEQKQVPRKKKPYAAPTTRECTVAQRSAVLLECTGQYNCGNVGFPGCCQPDEDSCFVNC
ncbi:MAG: hypothetical protein AB1938_28270 [Myxococcota bacterium]